MLALASEVKSTAEQALLVRNYSAAKPVSMRDASNHRTRTPRGRAVPGRDARSGSRADAGVRHLHARRNDHGEADPVAAAAVATAAKQARNPVRVPSLLGGRWSTRPGKVYSTCREERLTASAVMSAIFRSSQRLQFSM